MSLPVSDSTTVTTEVTLGGLEGCPCAFCSKASEPGLAEQAARAADQTYGHSGSQQDQNIDALLTGVKWATTSLTFSFPDSASDYSYRGYLNVRDTFQPLNATQEAAARTALGFYESISGLRFQELDGPADADADLMFAMSSAPPTAFAYYPSNSDVGGDSWFNTSSYNTPVAGNYAWATFMHEIGHALGLKHGHETNGAGAIQAAFDSHEYSLMTYRSYVGSAGTAYTNGTFGGPQTPMMLDIAAIQRMYGANFDFAAEDTTYTFSTTTGQMFANGVGAARPGGNFILRTIWDGGGVDTYDLSNYTRDLVIDLAPGGYVDLDANGNAQRAYLGGGVSAKGHVFNALLFEGDTRSLIEAAIGGSGDDLIFGNEADNRLSGGAGADTLSGLVGDDTLIGGAGADVFLFDADRTALGERDLILDLNFAQGDKLDLRGFGAGAFAGLALDGAAHGDGATLASLDDLVRGGTLDFLSLSASDLGGTLLSVTDGNWNAVVELASINFDSVQNAITGLSTEPLSPVIEAPVKAPSVTVPEPKADPAPAPGATEGSDHLTASGDGDWMVGLGGNDVMNGGAGRDTLDGGGGADSLYGGKSSDLLMGGKGRDMLRGGADLDDLHGDGGRDRLFGGGGADNLNGDGGKDLLVGGGGADVLLGDGGADTLRGGGGADRLEGGRGGDVLVGGGGADQFVFGARSGTDRIKDFGKGADRLEIEGATSLSDLRIVVQGDDLHIQHDGGRIILEDTDRADISAADFLF